MNPPIHVSPDETNPKDRIGDTKPPLRLIPGPALVRMAMVMGLGAKKYGPYNWREKKVRYTVYLEAAQRHILSALDGEDIDPESGQPHTAHAAACMAIILDAEATGNLVDDRPTPGVTAKLIAELTAKKLCCTETLPHEHFDNRTLLMPKNPSCCPNRLCPGYGKPLLHGRCEYTLR